MPGSVTEAAPDIPMPAKGPSAFFDHVQLTKPRITLMVVITTAAGLLMAARVDPDLERRLAGSNFLLGLHVVAALLGTSMLAAGASALNMWSERSTDGLMRRTAQRPLPTGRLLPDRALETGLSLAAAGFVSLFVGVNAITAFLGALTLFTYVWVYTPLKRRTPWNTHIGTIPGALPILMGYTAWNGEVGPVAWAMFGFLLVWQLPHFFAIDWLYRKDYEDGGYKMLSSADPSGRRTAIETILFTVVLIAISLSPPLLELTTLGYPIVAALLGLWFLFKGLQFARSKTQASARATMMASVLYLPLVLGALVIDAVFLGSGWLF